jgi:hypothetical protein
MWISRAINASAECGIRVTFSREIPELSYAIFCLNNALGISPKRGGKQEFGVKHVHQDASFFASG